MTRTVPGRTDHVVVVGAGLAGLSAALHLLGTGRRMTLLERDAHPGGRAGRLDLETERGTYRVDTGPTVLTMPDLLDEAFAAVGEKAADRLDLVELHPAYRAHFADGSTMDVHTDAAAMEHEVRSVCGPAAAAGYVRMRDWLTRLYRAEIDSFIGANLDSPLDLLGADLARLAALGEYRSGTARRGARPSRRCTIGRSGVSTTASHSSRTVSPTSAGAASAQVCRTAVTRPPRRSRPVAARP